MKAGAVVGAAAAVLGIVFIVSSVKGAGCFTAWPNNWYYITWPGDDMNLHEAMGEEAWQMTFDIEEEIYPDVWQSIQPAHESYIIQKRQTVRWRTVGIVDLCGFRKKKVEYLE